MRHLQVDEREAVHKALATVLQAAKAHDPPTKNRAPATKSSKQPSAAVSGEQAVQAGKQQQN